MDEVLKRIYDVEKIVLEHLKSDDENLTNCCVKIDNYYKRPLLDLNEEIKKREDLVMEQNITMVDLLSASEKVKEQNLGLLKYSNHKKGCASLKIDGITQCDCGYEEIIK